MCSSIQAPLLPIIYKMLNKKLNNVVLGNYPNEIRDFDTKFHCVDNSLINEIGLSRMLARPKSIPRPEAEPSQ